MQDIDSLPWRPFKDGVGEWIFEDEAGQELIELPSKQGGKATIGEHVYLIAKGRGKRFTRRKPTPNK